MENIKYIDFKYITLPEILKVGIKKYKIDEDDELEHLDGVVFFHEDQIKIDKRLNEDNKVITLLHELFHLFVTHSGMLFEEKMEESIVDGLAYRFVEFLSQNDLKIGPK